MKEIHVPTMLKARPTWKGLPVPYVALIKPDGEPDFRVTDERTRLDVIRRRHCQLCGQRMGRELFFVGGPEAAANGAYFEPATHLPCLIYAMQVCPFIAGKMEHATLAEVQADNPHARVNIDETYTSVKSELWVIIKATDYKITQTQGGTWLVLPMPIVHKTAPFKAQGAGPEFWRKLEMELRHA